MQVLLKAKRAGLVGHYVVIQDIVVGSERVSRGQISTHSSLFEVVL